MSVVLSAKQNDNFVCQTLNKGKKTVLLVC